MTTWLEDINMLEASVTGSPANLKRKIFQKHSPEDNMPTKLWIPEETLKSYFAKSDLTDSQVALITASLTELHKGNESLEAKAFKSTHSALAELLGFGHATEELEQLKKSAETDKAELLEVIKSVVAKLEADTPAVSEAIVDLAKLAGVTPTIKRLDALPPELKSDWEALVKSREADRRELEEMKKAMADRDEQMKAREFVAKAKADHPNVPLEPEALGKLLHAVADNEEASKSLGTLLAATGELAEKSALFTDVGSGRPMPPGTAGVEGEIEGLAKALIQKSDKPLTEAQAFTLVLEQNPQLYDRYIKSLNA